MCVSVWVCDAEPQKNSFAHIQTHFLLCCWCWFCVFFYSLLSVFAFAQHILTINHSGLCRVAPGRGKWHGVCRKSAPCLVCALLCVGQCDLFYISCVCVCLAINGFKISHRQQLRFLLCKIVVIVIVIALLMLLLLLLLLSLAPSALTCFVSLWLKNLPHSAQKYAMTLHKVALRCE